jgi:hypothetical protein
MQTQHTQLPGLRAASISLTISVIGLWILIPLIVIISVLLFFTSILFNDSGHVPQAVVPFVGGILLFDVGLAILLGFSMRARHDLAKMLPRARITMLVFGVIYTLIAIGVLLYPFPDPLAIIPGTFGIWWLIYFLQDSTRAAFESPHSSSESLPQGS